MPIKTKELRAQESHNVVLFRWNLSEIKVTVLSPEDFICW